MAERIDGRPWGGNEVMTIRTIDAKTFQLRFDWTGFALFFGAYRGKAIKLYWWRYPRLVLDFWDSNPVIIGRRFKAHHS